MMTIYARIVDGAVAELFSTSGDIAEMFHPSMVWVECDGSVKVGWAYANGVFSAPAPAPAPTPAESAQLALYSGLEVTSTSSPGINGTYAVDQAAQMDIVAIETSINAGKGFPSGATTFGYPDMTGALHQFSETEFTAFAAAVRDYVYALRSVASGQSSMLPAAAITIA